MRLARFTKPAIFVLAVCVACSSGEPEQSSEYLTFVASFPSDDIPARTLLSVRCGGWFVAWGVMGEEEKEEPDTPDPPIPYRGSCDIEIVAGDEDRGIVYDTLVRRLRFPESMTELRLMLAPSALESPLPDTDPPDYLFRFDSASDAESFEIGQELGTLATAAGDTREDGTVHILDPFFNAVRRYSIPAGRWLDPLEVDGHSTSMALDPVQGDIYIGHADGHIDVYRDGSGDRQLLARLQDEVSFMAVVGPHLYALEGASYSVNHRLLRRDTGEVAAEPPTTVQHLSAVYDGVYSPASQRLFVIDEGDELNGIGVEPEAGRFAGVTEFPYWEGQELWRPLRLSPDQSRIVTSTGLVFNTEDLSYADSIGVFYRDLRFVGDAIFIMDEHDGRTRVRELSPQYAVVDSHLFLGVPERLFVHDGRVVAFTRQSNGSLGAYPVDSATQ